MHASAEVLPEPATLVAIPGDTPPAGSTITPDHAAAPLPSPVTALAASDPAVPALSEAKPDLPMVEGYVLRRALTRAPVPLAQVAPAWPEGIAPNEPQLGRFTLFINEAGGVDRVVPDGPSLFPALEESAVAAFSAARFQPGEVDGRQVRSLIRIEVLFEPRATSVPGAVVVSRQNL
jgi:protein TonB